MSALQPFDVRPGTVFMRAGGVIDETDGERRGDVDSALTIVVTMLNADGVALVVGAGGRWAGQRWAATTPSHREIALGFAHCVREREKCFVTLPRQELGAATGRLDAMHAFMLAAGDDAPERERCACGRMQVKEGCVGCALVDAIATHEESVRKGLQSYMAEYMKDYRLAQDLLVAARVLAADAAVEPLAVLKKLLELEDAEFELGGDTQATSLLVTTVREALGLDDDDVYDLRSEMFERLEQQRAAS